MKEATKTKVATRDEKKKQRQKDKEQQRKKKEPGGAGREHGVRKEKDTAGTKPMKE